MKHILPFLLSLLCFFFSTSTIKAQIVINEFLPNSSQEWVEFYNTGSNTEDLSNYFFDDDTDFNSDGGNSAKVPLSGILTSLETCYLDLSTYLNNNGDSPTLFKIDQSQQDSYNYDNSTTPDKSYSRIPDGGSWQTDQTPTKSTVRCSDSAPTPNPTQAPTATPTNTPTSVATPVTTKTPTPTPVKTSTPKPTTSSTPEPTESSESEVLGLAFEESPVPTSESEEDHTKNKSPLLPVIFIGSGVLMVGFAVYNLIRAKRLPVQT
jgi:hypothetical protein